MFLKELITTAKLLSSTNLQIKGNYSPKARKFKCLKYGENSDTFAVITYYVLCFLRCLEPWQCWCSDQCSYYHSDRQQHGGHRGKGSRLIADWLHPLAGRVTRPNHCRRKMNCCIIETFFLLIFCTCNYKKGRGGFSNKESR